MSGKCQTFTFGVGDETSWVASSEGHVHAKMFVGLTMRVEYGPNKREKKGNRLHTHIRCLSVVRVS